MKLARYGNYESGLIVEREGDQLLVDIGASLERAELAAGDLNLLRSAFVPRGSWVPLIADWDRAAPALSALEHLALAGDERIASASLDGVTFCPPLPEPSSRVFALGGNFRDHIDAAARAVQAAVDVQAALDEGLPPWGFFVIPGTTVGSDVDVTPPAWVEKLDFEAEVAVILRDGSMGMDSGDLEIWGYTAWNDLSIRDGALGLTKIDPGPGINWALQKNFVTGNPCGPWLVVDEPLVGRDVRFESRVNGETRQSSTTAEMMYGFGEVVAWLTRYLPLGPGDVLLSGTSAGTAVEQGHDGPFLRTGDIVEVEVEGIGGVLRNTIRFE